MDTRMTVIVDNVSADGIEGEWGLSILIQLGDNKILLDTGASELFAENFAKLGFDIRDVDYGVLSHAHYDHANGMPKFFEENSKAKFYLRDKAAENCYHKKLFAKKYIGIRKNVLEKYKDRIEYVSGDYKLCEGAYLIPHKTAKLSRLGRRECMYCRTDRGWKVDDFSHEQSLVIETEKGLVILNSCSHGGALNIINEVKSTFPDKKIYAYIGGLHLFNKSKREVQKVAQELKESEIQCIYTGHCTKSRAYGILQEDLGDRLHKLHVGLKIEF